ncbi:MAG TPA: UvrD-helicase domain-containing protein [Candidatus Nanopelagicales bacterium]|nr:UvrD-helicase domain-containing protein [Candidatus Nanopelagicales bacterium]
MNQGGGGTHQNRSERDSFVSMYADRIAALDAVENRLLFGRTDTDDGPTWIGRLGLSDLDQRVLQIDWRAPAAAAFYQATAANPMGLVRRRHITTEARQVLSLSDEVFDPDAVDPATVDGSSDSALLSALRAVRTGRMGDIVATIQAEQDRIIRADVKGALVVQGGPGTGKTAVALHRAAYLLYTHRDRYERSGVLVVGPTAVFLRYVEEVLPSLGETGVVLTSIAELVPGVVATSHDRGDVARVKGSRVMAEVLANAVAARRRVPANGVTFVVDGARVHLSPSVIRRAGHDAVRDHETHNAARPYVLTHLLNQAATRLARKRGFDPGDSLVREDLLAELREERAVRRELNLLWMPLTPQRVLVDLHASPAALRAAADGLLGAEQQALLLRDAATPFTVDDVPLLDELAALVGDDPSAARAEAARREAEERRAAAFAASVLETTTDSSDSESIEGYYQAMVSGEQLAGRFAEEGPALTLAERAAGDREWAYAHVVVDEAQELSAMAWRAIARRCPSRSMTVVGDLAQTSSEAGAHSWRDALEEVSRGVWRVEELTINYRTPARIAELADRVLAAMHRDVTPPRAVREGEHDPGDHVAGDVVAAVVGLAAELSAAPGRSVVVAVEPRCRALVDALVSAGVDAALGPRGLDVAVAVMSPTDVKGLEFDNVVLVEPAEIRGAPTGLADLYVALTRATSRLEIVRTGDLPSEMR